MSRSKNLHFNMKQEGIHVDDMASMSEKRKVTKDKNMRWNDEMDRVLADVLRDERNMGRKGDGGWKTTAYSNAASKLSTTFKMKVRGSHVQNRVKCWKKIHGIVSGILSESGLNWDSTRHMIQVDDDDVWEKYCMVHDKVDKYRYKVIPNWNDIVDLCGKDRATGEGAETAIEANDVMSTEASSTQDMDDVIVINDSKASNKILPRGKRGPSSSSSVDPPPKKRVGDDLSSAVSKMATSLENFMQSNKLNVDEVYDEVQAIPDLDRQQRLRALNWLVDNENKFRMLRKLPIDEKKEFLLMCLP